jgi:DNA polymerase III subunit alpha
VTWVPLHARSQYSILSSTVSVQDLVDRAKLYGLPALALTDQGNLYGAVEFYKACKANGIKPILGCELNLAPQSRLEKKRVSGHPSGYPIVLLVKNREGYRNLCKLCSKGFLEGFYYTPRIDKDLLKEHAEGLICLSGSLSGTVASFIIQKREEELANEIKWFKEVFGQDYYLEIQRHPLSQEKMRSYSIEQETWLYQKMIDFVEKEKQVEKRLQELSREFSIPLVATNDSRYLDAEDWKAHEILLNILSGEPCEIWETDSHGNPKQRISNPKRDVEPTLEYAFKSPAEMMELFVDMPEALENTASISAQCEFELDLKSKFYPVFVPPGFEEKTVSSRERLEAAEDFLKHLCEVGIQRRYPPQVLEKIKEKIPDKDPMNIVRERLVYELEIIISKGMCDYLLIVYDFIDWAKKNGIPMGPGRGSGAGSIILYLIGVTDIEPLRFSLFFERFINPERISYPDIDVDICMDRRMEVIDYVVGKYGKDKVAQIITFGTMKAKMAIKDVGRVLSVPLVKVNAIAKLVPEDPTMTLERALQLDPELRTMVETDTEAAEIISYAKKLEGSVRNTGIHAAGIIIGGGPLTEHIPLCTAKDSDMAVTQFSMKPVEAVGMLKIDFLGLKTLTSIQKAVGAIQKERGVLIDWLNLPLDDTKTFDLLNQGKTLGVFQLESGGMQDLAQKLHIDRFEEIIAVGALYRPGPMEMIPSFIQRKHGKESIDIDHPWMQDILAETYGIMVYQEQVMQIASRLAGYTLGEGDVLRRAMGKKDHEEMSNQREKFKKGALSLEIDEATSMRIFDKVEKFASYGFNKSHAAAYGYLSYVTAYLKANFSSEWMAALMTCDRDDVGKISKMIRESRSLSIDVLAPDVNESGTEFRATTSGIRFALAGIKGVGEGVVEVIMKEREKSGFFTSLFDFLKRVDTRKINKKAVEQLIEAGAFDFSKSQRAQLLLQLEPLYQEASKSQREAVQGILTLFSFQEELRPVQTSQEPETTKTALLQLLKKEKELLGFYLTGHPLDHYREWMKTLSCLELQQALKIEQDAVFRSMFIIESVQVKLASRSGRKFAILTISDGDDHHELPIWSDLYETKAHLIQEGKLLYAVLQIDRREDVEKLNCKWIDDLTKIDETMIKACDMAYDRAKMQLRQIGFDSREIKPQKKMPLKTEEKSKRLLIELDLDKVRLSHILELKKWFRSHSGSQPIIIRFLSETQPQADLYINATWGVTVGPELEIQVKNIPSVIKFAVE